jgi:flagellar protein FlbD
MIHLTRLNNQPLVVNADLIKFIENAPDTVITLLTGETLIVRESVAEVLERIGDFQRRFHRRIAAGTPLDNALTDSESRAGGASQQPKGPDDSKR